MHLLVTILTGVSLFAVALPVAVVKNFTAGSEISGFGRAGTSLAGNAFVWISVIPLSTGFAKVASSVVHTILNR